MKYIIVKGARSSGKAETIHEVCRRLKPDVIRKVYFSESGKVSLEKVPSLSEANDGTYVITVRKKNVLVVSGAPTQQRKSITEIMESVQNLNLKPDFAIVAMRGLEKLKDFATSKELEKFGKCIYETKIWRIPSNKFNLTDEWNKRVSYLTAITLHNI
ncbi:hypothetical protein [Flavobacterium subsaxonicum]|uniref:Uncharacterized protein n=1 Tax=Flavobacterium subsaxonicum WB 4.1-42 = DSM 21790 TaxID=1121898 RepID=A0A0A2MG10_9FLAO|nr:hypothetical protein [Flavobacterium subsaxonicum]KGO91179.1 hypothetical protein Q766_19180 [Flavobacterium subsaxonicum WB 4.1-42 = DSM 21790]